MRVSVVIPAWNCAHVLDACLDSLATQRVTGGFETIVVDDCSTDATAARLAARGDAVRVHTNERNAGFAASNNTGAALARGDVLLFLNSDTVLQSDDVLERLARTLEDPGIGIVAPALINADGSRQVSCGAFPSLRHALLVATSLQRALPQAYRARYAPHRWAHDCSIDTDWVMGAALAMRREVFASLGGWWEEPAPYAEEIDLAYRVHGRGLRVRYDAGPVVMHLFNQSLAGGWSDLRRAERVEAAEVRFLRTHYAPARRFAIRAVTVAGYAARTLVHGALGRRERARTFAAMARTQARSAP